MKLLVLYAWEAGTDFSEAGEQNIFSHSDQESLSCPLEFGLPDPHLQEKRDRWRAVTRLFYKCFIQSPSLQGRTST